MSNEKKYTEADLRASYWTGTRDWLEQNASRLLLVFGLGFCSGFLLCLSLIK